MISEPFGIKSDYHGSIVSNLARLNMKDAVEDANEKHTCPWSDMCAASGVTNTPLSPFIDQVSVDKNYLTHIVKELLYNNSLCVNGTKICSTGFQYTKPEPTLQV